jgi:F0F1-type ATP synthase alpha subunit
MVDVGTVVEIGDGVAKIHGLTSSRDTNELQFPNDVGRARFKPGRR